MSDRAPRIDTVRNQGHATITLLEKTIPAIEYLHDLAYSRHSRNSDEPNVAGGHRDYALDNHGDPKARDAYRHLATAFTAGVEPIAIACHQALRILNDGQTPGTNRMHPATITVLEHIMAIDAQRRRIAQGEPDPARQFPQPKEAKANKAYELELVKLRRELVDKDAKIAKLERRVDTLRDKLTDLRRRRAVGS